MTEYGVSYTEYSLFNIHSIDDNDIYDNDDNDDGDNVHDDNLNENANDQVWFFSYTEYSLHNIHREMEVRRGIDSISLKVQ